MQHNYKKLVLALRDKHIWQTAERSESFCYSVVQYYFIVMTLCLIFCISICPTCLIHSFTFQTYTLRWVVVSHSVVYPPPPLEQPSSSAAVFSHLLVLLLYHITSSPPCLLTTLDSVYLPLWLLTLQLPIIYLLQYVNSVIQGMSG